MSTSSVSKRIRELIRNLEKWRDQCAAYEAEHIKEKGSGVEYYRGGKEAFDRALDRTHQLFMVEASKPEHAQQKTKNT